MSVRVRFAPSPTGNLHVGGARTALFNYLFAKSKGGRFVLRVEDTDKERSLKEFEDAIRESFEWLGITPDESPWHGGSYGPYRQSERAEIYRSYLEKLLKAGLAFWCGHPSAKNEAYGEVHWCEYRESPEARPGIIRFKSPRHAVIAFSDLVRGKIEYNTEELGDFALAKDLDSALYNFANTVDDHEMEITHVLRGEEHISNTLKQILIRESLDLRSFEYGHFPLILGSDRTKLSKRQGATSILDFNEQGYLPEALINFIALLGWNPGGTDE